MINQKFYFKKANTPLLRSESSDINPPEGRHRAKQNTSGVSQTVVYNQHFNQGFASISLMAVLSVLIVIGLLVFSWYRLIPDNKTKNETVLNLESDIAELEGKLKQVDEVRTILNRVNPSLSRLELSMPEDEQVPELIVILNSLAAGSGLNDVTFTLADSDTVDIGSGYLNTSLQIVGQGFYDGIQSFLNNLYINIRPIQITSITLAPATEDQGAGTEDVPEGYITFTLQGQAYSRSTSPQATDQTADQAALDAAAVPPAAEATPGATPTSPTP